MCIALIPLVQLSGNLPAGCNLCFNCAICVSTAWQFTRVQYVFQLCNLCFSSVTIYQGAICVSTAAVTESEFLVKVWTTSRSRSIIDLVRDECVLVKLKSLLIDLSVSTQLRFEKPLSLLTFMLIRSCLQAYTDHSDAALALCWSVY